MSNDPTFISASLSSEADWRKLTGTYPAPYSHDYGYCRAISHSIPSISDDQFELLVIKHAGRTVGAVPLVTRSYRGHTDIYTPYGCDAWVEPGEEPLFSAALSVFGKTRGHVAGYIAVAIDKDNSGLPAEFETSRSSLVVKLEDTAEAQWPRIKSNVRQAIRAIENDPEITLFHSEPPMTDEIRSRFATLYREFLERTNPAPVYWLPRETLDRLCRLETNFLVGAMREDEIVAASLFETTSEKAVYMLNAALEEYRHTSAALIWRAMRAAIDLGITSFNLGGGISERDSLWWFKSRFDGNSVPQYSLKQIYRADTFATLCTDVEPGAQKYFPPYQHASNFYRTPED